MAPDETPIVDGGIGPAEPAGGRLTSGPSGNPRQLTPRERRRRIILLAILIALLLLLSYLTYYYVQNRRLPTMSLAPAASDYVQPPRYLYSISGTGASELNRPVGVGVAEDGRVYVVDFGNRRVNVFANRGTLPVLLQEDVRGRSGQPVHLAVKGNEVWVSDRRYRTIFIFDLEGKYLRKYEPEWRQGLHVDPARVLVRHHRCAACHRCG